MRDAPKVIVIAGPNGAGKTTFAREFLPGEADCPAFVNADLIAAGLAPFAPETASVQAGRLMLAEMARHFAARQSFAFETTLAGRGYVSHIRAWQAAAYRVKLIFLQLDSPETAIARVWHSAYGKAGTTFPRRRSGGVLPQAAKTSNTCTPRWSTRGCCTTTRALSPCCSTGARSHEPTAHRRCT